MRLFVAIELEPQVRRALSKVQDSLRRSVRDVKWVDPELMHLTVKFLGDVPDGDVPRVTRAVERAAGRSEAFEMAVGGTGCFPPRGNVRVVWAGVSEPSGLLKACVQAAEEELAQEGFPPEQRGFSAHITLGRIKFDKSRGAARDAVTAATLQEKTQSVGELVLMSSVLSRQGPTYTPVARTRLAGSG